MTPIHKGDICIVHVQKRGYSMLAGQYVYSRFWLAEVLKSTRAGEVKEYRDNNVTSARSRVDRFVTVYSVPDTYSPATLKRAFAAQSLDFTGHETKEGLRAALDAAATRRIANV